MVLGLELGDGWTIREIAGLVFVAVMTTWAWIKLRQMQFPEEWEHGPGPKRDPKEPKAPGPPPPSDS
jgi:hypothetical protein